MQGAWPEAALQHLKLLTQNQHFSNAAFTPDAMRVFASL